MRIAKLATFFIVWISASHANSQFLNNEAVCAQDQQAEKSLARLQAEATEIMRRQVGAWHSRWEILDANGKVTKTVEGTKKVSFAIRDRVLKIESDMPSEKQKSVMLKFFKPETRRFYFVSVDQNGDLWTFHEEVGLDDSWSDPHVNADKTVTYLRFTTLRKTENEIDVVMEASSDNKVWTKVFKQYQVRKKDK